MTTKVEEFIQHLAADFTRRAMEGQRGLITQRITDMTDEQTLEFVDRMVSLSDDPYLIRRAILDLTFEGPPAKETRTDAQPHQPTDEAVRP